MKKSPLKGLLYAVLLGLLVGFALDWYMAEPANTKAQIVKTEMEAATKVTFTELVDHLRKADPKGSQLLFLLSDNTGRPQNALLQVPSAIYLAEVPAEPGAAELYSTARTLGIATDAFQLPPKPAGWGTLLWSLVPTFLMIALWVWFFRGMRGGNPGANMTKAGTKVEPAKQSKTFADVAGQDSAKAELEATLRYLKNPGRLKRLGGKPNKGILLIGPPGNGKTLLAKALAGESGAAFFEIAASEFMQMYVGVGAARVRDLFERARKQRPAIVFIDELDAVGKQRGTGVGNGHDEREQTLNQLLVELDGFIESDGIVLVAATNRPDVLDPALTRPGRFDLQVLVDYPDLPARLDILKVHTRNKVLAPDVDLNVIAQATPGFSGAQLEGVCNHAALVTEARIEAAYRVGTSTSEEITIADFDEGVARVQMGPAANRAMTPEQKRNTAVHEVGHAFVSWWRHIKGLGGDPISKITIIPRARALGYTQAVPNADRVGYTNLELGSRIMMALGGRAAQESILGVVDTGAQSDFNKAWELARDMVAKYGMSPLGIISAGDGSSGPFLGRSMAVDTGGVSQELAAEIDAMTRKILETAHKDVVDLIDKHRTGIDKIVGVLLEQETILGPQWDELAHAAFMERG